jgi:hypothetical protein
MSKHQHLFNWLQAKFARKPKTIIRGGAHSETPNYYAESGFEQCEIAGQQTRLNLTEDSSGRRWVTVGNDFSFARYYINL